MKSLKKKRRVQILTLAAVTLMLATGLIGYALRDGISFFRSPSQLVEEPIREGEIFRLGGLVEEGTLRRGQGLAITFNITDGGESIPASYTGVLPDLFGEGEGVVATGKLIEGVFIASEILAKHDESYMPKEVIDALKDQGVYVEPAT